MEIRTRETLPHFYRRFALLPFAVFTISVLLIHAQPYEDHQLRQLLLEGCPAPCFMGIRPGVTSQEEAEKVLNESKWVEKITFVSSTYISWTWSGQQPDWINQAFDGSLSLYNDRVIDVQFGTLLRFGNILLGMGANGLLQQTEYQPRRYALYSISYLEYGLRFDFSMDCKHYIPYLQPVSIIIGLDMGGNSSDANGSLQPPFFRCSD